VTEHALRLAAPPRALAAYGASLALHAALFAAILLVHPPLERRAEPISVEIVETHRPPPAAAPEPPPPAPEPRRIARPPPRVALAPTLPKDAPPPPAEPPDAPPPPNAAPSAPAAKPGPVRIGISMSSTTAAGGVAAPAGNTLYGKPPEQAGDPADAKPYRSERYVPPTQVTKLPELIRPDIPKSEYPAEAKAKQVEGQVRVRLLIDEQGRVQEVRLAGADPGYGFGKRALEIVRKYYRFRPALRNDEPVATELTLNVTFQLE
jgi:periplasmic protein TonB